MFKNFFKKTTEEPEFENVNPVVEHRRNEKFSKPLIYDEEFKEVKEETPEKVVAKPKVKPVQEKKKPVEEPKKAYQMMEIISPMFGASEKKETPKPKVEKPKKAKKKESGLIQVISPFYGDFSAKKEEPVETNEVLEVAQKEEVAEKPAITVEDNMRNIAKIVEENEEELRIIEERTGEFKFDFQSQDEKKKTLIDEINDNMSLDELMSLYEKKFKD